MSSACSIQRNIYNKDNNAVLPQNIMNDEQIEANWKAPNSWLEIGLKYIPAHDPCFQRQGQAESLHVYVCAFAYRQMGWRGALAVLTVKCGSRLTEVLAQNCGSHNVLCRELMSLCFTFGQIFALQLLEQMEQAWPNTLWAGRGCPSYLAVCTSTQVHKMYTSKKPNDPSTQSFLNNYEENSTPQFGAWSKTHNWGRTLVLRSDRSTGLTGLQGFQIMGGPGVSTLPGCAFSSLQTSNPSR